MKIIVIYSSQTGNTESVAQAIYEEFKEHATIIPMDQAKDYKLENYDYVFAGFWVDKGYPNEETMDFLKSIRSCNIGLFATLGAYPIPCRLPEFFTGQEKL